MAKKNKSYYFADGKKIYLTPMADLVAYSKVGEASPAENIRLVKKESFGVSTTSSDSTQIRKVSAREYPVYSCEAGGYMVALPEIRVLEQTMEPTAKFKDWLTKNKKRVRILEQKRGQSVLTPVSGTGEEAIEIANEIYLAIKPSMSQPRFLRIVDRPSLRS